MVFRVLVLVFAVISVSCSRKVEPPSTISFRMPAASTQAFGNPEKVDSLTSSTRWLIADPSSVSQFNCYAIAVEAPNLESVGTNSCTSLAGTAVLNPQFIGGTFKPGASGELEVTSGISRTIYLIGFYTDDLSKCVGLEGTAAGLANNHFSAPHILSKKTVNLEVGQQVVNLSLPSTMSETVKFEECLPYKFTRAPVDVQLGLASVSPSSGPAAGGTTITLSGSGFNSATSVSVGGNACTSAILYSSTSLTCVTAAHASGAVDIQVTRGIETASLASAFTYDSLPTVSVSATSIGESAGTLGLTVTLSATSATDVTFNYATTAGTAVSSLDYTYTSGLGTITAGTTTTAINVPIVSDSLDEANETFTVTLSGVSSNASLGSASAIVTVTDDDSAPNIDFSMATSSENENSGGVSISATLSAVSGQAISIPYTVSGTATGGGVDHDLAAGTMNITAGSSSGSINFNLVDNAVVEASRTVVVSFGTPTNAVLGTITTHTMTVNDDDPPTATIAGQPANPSNETTLDITIGGTLVTQYKYEIVADADCTTATFSGGLVPVGTHITDDISGLPDGDVTVCVLGYTAGGIAQTTATAETWVLDQAQPAAPSDVQLSSPASSPGNDDTPSFTVSGTVSGDTIKIYSEAGCSTEKGTTTAAGTTATLTSSTLSSNGMYTFYAKAFDPAGNSSACSTAYASYLFDATPPAAPGGLSDRSTGTSLVYSPYYFWDAAVDSDSGVGYYEVAIGTSAGASNVSTWTGPITDLAYYFIGLSLTDSATYYFSVRAVDMAGNVGASTSDQFTVDNSPPWILSKYVKAANAESADSFGTAVDIDGDYMVVGAPYEGSNQTTITNGSTASSDNSASSAGAAYVYKRTGTAWAQIAYLKAPNSESTDKFGMSVAISGDTIVVGAPYEDSNQTTITNGTTASSNNSLSNAGAAYVFRFDGSSWAQEAYLKASNAGTNNLYGSKVAIDGDTIVVSAPQENGSSTGTSATAGANSGATYSGAVYVYTRTGATWSFEAYVKASNTGANDKFGSAMAIYSDRIAVGSEFEDSANATQANNSASSAGAVYVFDRTGTTWSQTEYIKAPYPTANAAFGCSVALSDTRLVIGSWGEGSSDTTPSAGAPSNDGSSLNSGAAYVFSWTGAAWGLDYTLKASNNGTSDGFGSAVDIFGSTVAVGAPDESSSTGTVELTTSFGDDDANTSAGAVYLFQLSGSVWQQAAYVKVANNDAFDQFGSIVSISGATLAVGAAYEDSSTTTIQAAPAADTAASDSGAVYIFDP